ncbi:MAG TPA: hypothetical protein VF728_05225 [Nocardioides sp.]|jgi:hypothetical protein
MRSGARWAVLALLLAVGVVGGYAASGLVDDRPTASGPAVPVAASPDSPVDPPPVIAPDPDVPALETDLRTRLVEVGGGDFAVTVPVPVGWARTDTAATEAKWLVPGHPPHTYRLRVEVTSAEHTALADMVEERVEDLQSPRAALEQLTVLDQRSSSLEFTYVDDGYLRHALVTWVDLSRSGEAELEVALTGRERDVPGMQALTARIVAGARA